MIEVRLSPMDLIDNFEHFLNSDVTSILPQDMLNEIGNYFTTSEIYSTVSNSNGNISGN